MNHMTRPDGTVTLTFAARDIPTEFRPEVESVLRGLVPVVALRVKARRRERLEQLVDVLTQNVRIRELDVRHTQMQARRASRAGERRMADRGADR